MKFPYRFLVLGHKSNDHTATLLAPSGEKVVELLFWNEAETDIGALVFAAAPLMLRLLRMYAKPETTEEEEKNLLDLARDNILESIAEAEARE